MSCPPITSPDHEAAHTGEAFNNYGDESYANLELEEMHHLCHGSATDVLLVSRRQTRVIKKVMRVVPTYFGRETGSSGQELLDKIRASFGKKFGRWCLLKDGLYNETVKIYFVDTKALTLYEEYYIHGDLRKYAGRIASDSECIGIFKGLLRGLAFLHDQNPPIVHGCVNPGCIYVTGDLRVKLGEPSFSQLVVECSHLTPSISVDWLVRWMSPEFFEEESQHEPLTTQLDMWTLGCTFLEVITGRLPYNRYKSNTEILEQIIIGVPPSLGESFNSPREVFTESYMESIEKLAKQCWLPALARPTPWELYDKLSPLPGHPVEPTLGSGPTSPTLPTVTLEDYRFGPGGSMKGGARGSSTYTGDYARVYTPSASSNWRDQLNIWCDRVHLHHIRFVVTQTANRQDGHALFQAIPICRSSIQPLSSLICVTRVYITQFLGLFVRARVGSFAFEILHPPIGATDTFSATTYGEFVQLHDPDVIGWGTLVRQAEEDSAKKLLQSGCYCYH